MKIISVESDFDVDEISDMINDIMSRWSVFLIKIQANHWVIYNYNRKAIFEFNFNVDFNDLETRIKLEDLRLNVIHHIESLRDDTTYISNLITDDMII